MACHVAQLYVASVLTRSCKTIKSHSTRRLRMQMPKSASRWPVEVVSLQGWIVRLQNGSDVQQLPQLLRALPC